MPQRQNTLLKTYLLLACFIPPLFIFAQKDSNPPDFITIEQIYLEGNKRTKSDIILRELDFTIGDTIHLSNLTQRLQENEYNILNTGLVTKVSFSYKDWEGASNKVGLLISLKEDWYVFPFPILELADRNFNVWWSTYDHALDRLNWGIRFYHNNVSGRRDIMKAVLQFGFTKKYELIYSLPAFNASKTWGTQFNILHTREKEIAYTTQENRLVFHRNENNVLLQRFRLGAGISYRKKLDLLHRLDVTYRRHQIDESILSDFNPDFFLGQTTLTYFSLAYNMTWDKRDIRPYPMKGHYVSGSLTKDGLGLGDDVRSTTATVEAQQYFTLGSKWSFFLGAKGRRAFQRNQQPYYTSRALGYFEDFIRGYEFYVIDGLDYAYFKQGIRLNLLDKEINWGRYIRLDAYKKMPLKLFLVWRNETGYVNNPFYRTNNPLSNEWLWGSSIGMDVVLYYNKVFNFEYSRNHLGEHGFFLHWTFNF